MSQRQPGVHHRQQRGRLVDRLLDAVLTMVRHLHDVGAQGFTGDALQQVRPAFRAQIAQEEHAVAVYDQVEDDGAVADAVCRDGRVGFAQDVDACRPEGVGVAGAHLHERDAELGGNALDPGEVEAGVAGLAGFVFAEKGRREEIAVDRIDADIIAMLLQPVTCPPRARRWR